MGILLLPSLEEKRHIHMENVSQSEAEQFMERLKADVIATRKLTVPTVSAQIDDAYKIYRLLDNLDIMDLEAIVEELCESHIARHRGIRAAFIDEETNTILVGTTVVYSANWAMVGFDDSTLPDIIMEFDY